MKTVKVKTQIELDAALKIGDFAICIDGKFIIMDNATVRAGGNATVRAWDNATVRAWDNATVRAGGNVFIRLFKALKISVTASVVVMRYDEGKSDVKGGQIINAIKPQTAQEWCEFYALEVNDNIVVLYKAVTANYTSLHGMRYMPGTIPEASDWDGGELECGGGLHFSPTPFMAKMFKCDAVRFVACPINITDIVVHPNGDYPQKIKARGCYAPVWEVDINGKAIKEEVA